VPRQFEGELPNFNIGSNAAPPPMPRSQRVETYCDVPGFSGLTNGRPMRAVLQPMLAALAQWAEERGRRV